IRGAKTIVFYSLPEHSQFYSEFLETAFLKSKGKQGGMEIDEDVDEAEISAKVLVSRFDLLRLERVVGSEDARRMLARDEG
nr:hypothetical protein [Tanacetum cinerariifolium]